MNCTNFYRGKRVLVTGGLGFIGSNLVRQLIDLGAVVRVVDALVPGTGANSANLHGVEANVDIWRADLRDQAVVEAMVSDQEVCFNLAAQAGHLASMQDPQGDVSINAVCQLAIVEACRRFNPAIRIVYTATRQMYGRVNALPVDETHPVEPLDYNGVSKRAGELFHLVAHRVYGLKTTSLRLTNTYGPRMRCRDARLNFLGDWIRRLLRGQPLLVYGDGSQIRDLNYVDDVVDALLKAGAHAGAEGQVFNLGGGEPTRLIEIARALIAVYGQGRFELVPVPREQAQIEIGNYQADIRRICGILGWEPTIRLHEGLRRTLEFVEQCPSAYL